MHPPEAFLTLLTVHGGSFSPDGQSVLLSIRGPDKAHLYTIPLAGGEPSRLEGVAGEAISFFPDDERILFRADPNHDEVARILVRESSGQVHGLADAPPATAEFLGWSRDPAAMWIATNERSPREFDVYRYDARDYQRTRVFENSGEWTAQAVSADGRWLALARYAGYVASTLYLYDTRTGGEPVEITNPDAADGAAGSANQALAFAADSATLYYVTDAHGDFLELCVYAIEARRHECASHAAGDVTEFAASPDGRYQAIVINREGHSELRLEDTRSGHRVEVVGLPSGEIANPRFSPDSGKLLVFASDSRTPRALYVFDVAAGELRRLTDTPPGFPSRDELVEGRSIAFPSGDGQEIPALLYRPLAASEARPAPALVWLHGAALGGQSRLAYNGFFQYLLHRGYAVLAINHRGSNGYGKRFRALSDGKPALGAEDAVAAHRYLQSLSWVAGDRVAVVGVSFGGYLALTAAALHSDVFTAAINLWGPTDLITALERMPDWWPHERMYAKLGHPTRDADKLRAVSPLHHAGAVRAPVLIIQSANDPRDLAAQNQEFAARVRAAGVEARIVLRPDDGHISTTRSSQTVVLHHLVEFLDTWLR